MILIKTGKKMNKKKLLFHSCCAPCTVYPYKILKEYDLAITLFFYNPNIHPIEEYRRRERMITEYSKTINLPLVILDPDSNDTTPEKREEIWMNYPEDSRCIMCYDLRLKQTASYASENGFDMFSTTLLGSIYQDHSTIMRTGDKYSKEFGVEFYYYDFREGFRKGQKEARDLGIYRQKFCGCIKSLENSPFKDKILFSLKSDESSGNDRDS